MTSEFPAEGMEATHILVVSDTAASRRFYEEVVGSEIHREYGSSVVMRFSGTWMLLVTRGGPTPDKPEVTFAPPGDANTISHAITIRVLDCRGTYETLSTRGTKFLTPPVESESEIRAFFRDPDGHLLEISEAK